MTTARRYTADIPDDFFPQLEVCADKLETTAEKMLRVMKSESDVRADAWNDQPKVDKDGNPVPPEKRYNASGLIQFMPATLVGLGWKNGHAAFRLLTPTQQLAYVLRYYQPHVGYLGTVAGLYVATFLPALVTHCNDPSYVLTADPNPRTNGEPGERLGWAYAPNASFDANHDLAITVSELDDAVVRNARGARWDEIMARLTGVENPPASVAVAFDLRTIRGIQEALERLGFNPGPIDGYAGRKTSNAVMAFQASRKGLAVDGVVGPMTREALRQALLSAP